MTAVLSAVLTSLVAAAFPPLIEHDVAVRMRDGEFEPYRNEGRDGYDTIEWAAAQA